MRQKTDHGFWIDRNPRSAILQKRQKRRFVFETWQKTEIQRIKVRIKISTGFLSHSHTFLKRRARDLAILLWDLKKCNSFILPIPRGWQPERKRIQKREQRKTRRKKGWQKSEVMADRLIRLISLCTFKYMTCLSTSALSLWSVLASH